MDGQEAKRADFGELLLACVTIPERWMTDVMERRFPDAPIVFRAIGYVENSFTQPAPPEAIRSVESRIILRPDLVEGLEGLGPGDSLLVLFCFHLSEGYSLLQHPRGDRSRPKRGVFALRSPRRPNGIGATVVELVAVQDNVLLVRNLDAIDGTPVLDIKPA